MNRRIFSYTKEELVKHVILNDVKKEHLVKYVESTLIDGKEKEEFLLKITDVYKRIEIPLELDSKMFFLFFPFGIISAFSESNTNDIERYRENGNVQKIKDYRKYSLLGILMYLLLGILISLLK